MTISNSPQSSYSSSPFAASRRLNQESSGPQSSSCRQTPESAFCTSRRPIFNAPEGAGGGYCVPGAPENASRTTEGCSAHTNICSVPEKGVSGTEYHSRTREACFLHREPLKMRRVPQEPVFCTARIFRTTGGPLRYRMPQTRRSHILRRRLPRHQHHHYGHPPHGSRLGQETTALRKNLCNLFKKLRELSRSFLYLCRINTATRNANSLRPIQPMTFPENG